VKHIAIFIFCLLTAFAPASAMQRSASGIPLDAPWKVRIYRLARTTFIHPAWGWQHSERDYNMAIALAKGDGLRIDTDTLFAAAMLHDMAAFKPYIRPGEHGFVAAEESKSVLQRAGFPMNKFSGVAAAMRGHMYYSVAGSRPEAIVLHDADSLDFLGAIGAVRMISLAGAASPSAANEIRTLRGFIRDIPPKLVTRTARRIAVRRVAELRAILGEYEKESGPGMLP
jgi:uncharacterized protein